MCLQTQQIFLVSNPSGIGEKIEVMKILSYSKQTGNELVGTSNRTEGTCVIVVFVRAAYV